MAQLAILILKNRKSESEIGNPHCSRVEFFYWRQHAVLADAQSGGNPWAGLRPRSRRDASSSQKDAPSGTAKSLAKILAGVRKLQLEKAARRGRDGIVGERTAAEIGIHSIRGGDVVGDHTIIFANTGERVELTHKASSRDTFANGALRAALWVVKQKPGLYDMQDVLGLK